MFTYHVFFLFQSVMSTMLTVRNLPIAANPEHLEFRYPLSIVASKIMSGEISTKEKWDAVYK